MRAIPYFRGAAAAAVAVTAIAIPASAHVTLESSEAVAGSYHKVVLRIPHGCSGAATTAVRVQIPDGVVDVRPQPKPGWAVDTVIETLDEPVDAGHGNMVTETVREVHWTDGHLLDAHYDEFAMRVRLPDAPDTVLHFPAVQVCEEGVHRWIEIPEEGRSAHDYDEPAPALRLINSGGNGHSHGD